MFQKTQDHLGNAVFAHTMIGHFQAIELEQLADYTRATDGDEFAYLEVSTLLHISDRAAQRRMRFAVTLASRLQNTLACLKRGGIKAQLIADAVQDLSTEHARLVEARVLDNASNQTPAQLRHALAKAVLAVDPQGAEQRRERKKTQRCVTSQPTEDGEAVLSIYDSVEHIDAMHRAIASRARRLKAMGGETRTLAQLEADVARELILGSDCAQCTVEVHLTVPLDGQPAEIAGVGPITAQATRELVAEAKSWRWIRTNTETGEVLDLTYPRYQPPAVLAEFVRVRDRTCRYPGCVRPARSCDIDHQVPWPQGKTCDANCACLCRRHHRAKHRGRWDLQQTKPGHFKWTSPLGFTHTVRPDPVTRPQPPPDPDPPPF